MLSALNTDRPTGVPATDTRKGPYSPGALPAMRLITGPKEDTTSRLANGKRGPVATRRCQFLVECLVAGDEDDLEPLMAWATKALVPGRLDGLAVAVEETGTVWDLEAVEQDYLRAAVAFAVEYSTPVADQEHNVV